MPEPTVTVRMKEDGDRTFPWGTLDAMRLGAFFAHYRGKRFMKNQLAIVLSLQGGH